MNRYLRSIVPGLLFLAITNIAAARDAGPAKLQRAPDFTLPDYQGHEISLADFRGRVVLLQFMQTGCPVCQRHAPILEELYRKYKDKGLVVIGVAHGASGPEEVKQFAQRFDLTYFLLPGDLEIAVRYLGITPQASSFDVPRYFLISREGKIAKDLDPHVNADFARDEKGALEKAILEALGH